ncbi:flavin reductase [Microbacterium sp. BR1]|uniref:flavin reductase n=1 Tax=Microbacterium sp. BR1 TaxID=1070896 RepID=UPI001E5163E3|nr:flavin reductase [Microbacterium sp. BR1]
MPTETFRAVAGHFASGVTVITAHVEGRPFGTTASAVSSLSLEPPMMLVCLNRTSATHDAIAAEGRFGVSILARNQSDLAYRFAKKGDDKFDGVPVSTFEGIPTLNGAIATIVCDVEETAIGGTHTVFLGRVRHAGTQPGEPLTYFRGRLGSFTEESDQDVYEAVREWVMRRRTAVGEHLDPDELSAAVRGSVASVRSALIRLWAENLVTRDAAGSFFPAPLTVESIAGITDARTAMEVGVLEAYGTSSGGRADSLSRHVAALEAAREGHDLGAFLAASAQFHEALIAFSGSPHLLSAFRKLDISSVWSATLTGEEWTEFLDNRDLVVVADAALRGDARVASEAIAQHGTRVKAAAIRAVRHRGGFI